MKKLLLLICLLPALCQARELTFSGGGGITFAGLSGNGYSYDPMAAPSGMLSAAIGLRSLKAGVRADLFQVKGQLTYTDARGNEYKERFAYYDPALSFSAFVAKVFHHRILEVSIGMNAGIVTGVSQTMMLSSNSNPGFSIGIDAGVTHYFHKHLGVFANLSPRYIFNRTDALAFPLNLGISYRL
ncbi:hypothetical protein [Taibaiella helva]|uniref:hypothetical protein n=1 Tax=Taibaiella helva TaxID=2301235 RepID=UPI000E581503|nr:hypothetical protein [Taibaiella helva]